MILRKKVKENPMKGCAVSLLTLFGLLLICFVFCTVVFQLNNASVGEGNNFSGWLPLFGG